VNARSSVVRETMMECAAYAELAVATHRVASVLPVIAQYLPDAHVVVLPVPMQMFFVEVAASLSASTLVFSTHRASAVVPDAIITFPFELHTVVVALHSATSFPTALPAVVPAAFPSTQYFAVAVAASLFASVDASVKVSGLTFRDGFLQNFVVAPQSLAAPPAHEHDAVPQIAPVVHGAPAGVMMGCSVVDVTSAAVIVEPEASFTPSVTI